MLEGYGYDSSVTRLLFGTRVGEGFWFRNCSGGISAGLCSGGMLDIAGL